ncbi:hypothetical protein M3Y94_01109100 [Aphelenchoides besseyi]|nr:hypothetical protein M3Y94_01109100 [Aphelenchoides besseyi]
MDVHGKKLRVLFPKQFPAVNLNCNRVPHLALSADCPYPGLMTEIVTLIAQELKAKIEVNTLETNDNEFSTGVVTARNVTGLMSFVFTGEVDFLAYPLQRTVQRERYFTFSLPLYVVETHILHRRHDTRLNSLWSFFSIYDWTSWTLMMSILAVQFLFYIAQKYCQDYYKEVKLRMISDCLWDAMQISLGKSVLLPKRNYAVRFNLIVMQLLHVVTLLGIWSSWVLSKNIGDQRFVSIDTYADLIRSIEQNQRTFVTTTGTDFFFETLNRSQYYPFKSIRDALKNNPLKITGSKLKTLEEVNNNNGLAVVNEDDESMFMAKRYCNVIPMGEVAAVRTAHLIFKKRSPWIDPVNAAIKNNSVAIVRIFRKYMLYAERLVPKNCDHRQSNRITNHVTLPYYGLTLTWALLIAISIVFFFFECAVSFTVRQFKSVL